MLTLAIGAATDTGNLRGQNEDAHIAEQNLFAVPDGMGGHNPGEVASAMAIEHLRGIALGGLSSAEAFAQVVRDLNSAIYTSATSTTDSAEWVQHLLLQRCLHQPATLISHRKL